MNVYVLYTVYYAVYDIYTIHYTVYGVYCILSYHTLFCHIIINRLASL